MITRPLELLSKLRPPPRNFDFLFLINAGLIVLFFMLFGSRFVVSPALHLADGHYALPVAEQGSGSFVSSTISVDVTAGGRYIVETGNVTFEGLQEWLRMHVRRDAAAALLIRADHRVSYGVIVAIKEAATEAGIRRIETAYETSHPRTPTAP